MCAENTFLDYTITFFGTLLGAGVGAIATYCSAKSTWQNLHYNDAATRFEDAFLSEKIALRKSDEDVYRILTDTVMDRQERATVLFESYLTEPKKFCCATHGKAMS